MKNLRRFFAASLLSFMVLAVVGSGVALAAEEIRIGFTPPVTGQHAASGSFQVKAAKLAVKEINAAGGVNGRDRPPDRGQPAPDPGALAALNKAVEQDKVLAVIGYLYSTQVFAAADAIKNFGVPTFIGATNIALTNQGNPWLFRVRPDDSVAAGAMVSTSRTIRSSPIGLLPWDQDAFGTGGAGRSGRKSRQGGGVDHRPSGEVHDRGEGLHRGTAGV